MNERIHIYHTNDLHSHFEYWPRIQAFIKERKACHERAGEEVFIFDIGDFTDRYHPYTEGSMGKGNTLLLNEALYTAVTIGNNEGITLPHQHLDTLYKDANFDVIAANLYNTNHQRPHWVLPYKIYETKHGNKIGVTAVTTYYQKLYELLGWKVTEPFTELEMQLNRLKDETDMIIVLSHLGIHDDEKMAELFPTIDLILGAHTHHYFSEGKHIGHSMMAAAGKYGQFVGSVDIELKKNTSINMVAKLYDTAQLPPAINEERFVHKLYQIGKTQLNKEVATISEPLNYAWDQISALPQLLCKALHEWCQPDCTLLNSGLILTSLEKGKVTKYDLHRMLPHPINPCTVKLSGAELREVLFHSLSEEWYDLEVKGLGFRGKVMGCFVYHGVEMDKSTREVYIGGNILDPEKTYTLGTTDMFTFGKFFPEIQRSPNKHYYMPEFLRDVMEWKLQQIDRTI